ncbi:MAG TPA: hypothetical protein VH277_06470 [Gemmatimonadaceae bacterium]|jgi:hypothetical protein|nr:hypothetical protein [Gemmatimonadaceae bacterium]
MPDERNLSDDVSIASQSSAAASSTGEPAIAAGDLDDEIPVPPAMSPAEIDERAQVVEALRGTGTRSAGPTAGDEASPPADA